MPPNASLPPRGAVFYMPSRELKSPLPHYLVVLNANAETDKYIVLSVITSQLEECRRRTEKRKYAEGTLVECSPADYPVLSKSSMIDCNACIGCPTFLFRQDLKTATRCMNVPQELLERILDGVRLSKTKPKIKKLLGLA